MGQSSSYEPGGGNFAGMPTKQGQQGNVGAPAKVAAAKTIPAKAGSVPAKDKSRGHKGKEEMVWAPVLSEKPGTKPPPGLKTGSSARARSAAPGGSRNRATSWNREGGSRLRASSAYEVGSRRGPPGQQRSRAPSQDMRRLMSVRGAGKEALMSRRATEISSRNFGMRRPPNQFEEMGMAMSMGMPGPMGMGMPPGMMMPPWAMMPPWMRAPGPYNMPMMPMGSMQMGHPMPMMPMPRRRGYSYDSEDDYDSYSPPPTRGHKGYGKGKDKGKGIVYEDGRFVGVVREINMLREVTIIGCPEIWREYRKNVILPDVMQGVIIVGDQVSFSLVWNRGQPEAIKPRLETGGQRGKGAGKEQPSKGKEVQEMGEGAKYARKPQNEGKGKGKGKGKQYDVAVLDRVEREVANKLSGLAGGTFAGIIKSFSHMHGYGFIYCEEVETCGGGDVYFTRSRCKSMKNLKELQPVFFELEVHPQIGCQPQATKVRSQTS